MLSGTLHRLPFVLACFAEVVSGIRVQRYSEPWQGEPQDPQASQPIAFPISILEAVPSGIARHTTRGFKSLRSIAAFLATLDPVAASAATERRPVHGSDGSVGDATQVSVNDMLKLRGGALSHEEIISKLNRVPTFAIVDGEDNVIPIPTETGEEEVCWFTDAAEAKDLLELTRAANPDVQIHLAVTPLGEAFSKCGGWPDANGEKNEESESRTGRKLKLCGPRKVVETNAEALRSQQQAQGIEPGGWVLPIYCSDDFQTDQLMPMFFSTEDLQAGWVRSGRDQITVPENMAVMELRVLVKQMAETDIFNWSIFQFVSSEAAYKLAQELMTERQAREAEKAAEDEDDGDGKRQFLSEPVKRRGGKGGKD